MPISNASQMFDTKFGGNSNRMNNPEFIMQKIRPASPLGRSPRLNKIAEEGFAEGFTNKCAVLLSLTPEGVALSVAAGLVGDSAGEAAKRMGAPKLIHSPIKTIADTTHETAKALGAPPLIHSPGHTISEAFNKVFSKKKKQHKKKASIEDALMPILVGGSLGALGGHAYESVKGMNGGKHNPFSPAHGAMLGASGAGLATLINKLITEHQLQRLSETPLA